MQQKCDVVVMYRKERVTIYHLMNYCLQRRSLRSLVMQYRQRNTMKTKALGSDLRRYDPKMPARRGGARAGGAWGQE